jgi:glycosyltransferase involved in cell wall biosynthesis
MRRQKEQAHKKAESRQLITNQRELMDALREKKLRELHEHVPVSVSMIVKNCASSIVACLASLNALLVPGTKDEIVIVDTGSTDNTVQLCRDFGARVIERPDLRVNVRPMLEAWLPDWQETFEADPQFDGGMILDFAAARTVALDACQNDCVFWIDSDDTLQENKPGALREVINEGFRKKFDALFLVYDYAYSKEDQRLITTLKRERVIDKTRYYWAGRCHESLIVRPGMDEGKQCFYPDIPVKVCHTAHRQDHRRADVRNYLIMKNEMTEDFDAERDTDIRTRFYLGNACRGLKLDRESIDHYHFTLNNSGSRDDRYAAQYYIGQIYLTPPQLRPLDALEAAFECMKLKPKDPRAYFLASRAYALTERWEECIMWFKMGKLLPIPTQEVHSMDPEQCISFPLIVAAKAYCELERPDDAEAVARELVQMRPDFPDTKMILQEVANAQIVKVLEDGIRALVLQSRPNTADQAMDAARTVLSVAEVVPTPIEKQGLSKVEPEDQREAPAGMLREEARYTAENGQAVVEVIEHSEPRNVMIYCGPTYEPWGPENRKTGISGSERMVLMMAPKLQERGAQVSVYANVPHDQRGVDEYGTLWRHWAEFDKTRPRDVAIFWRSPEMTQLQFPAKKRIVWCHDVQNPARWTPERVAMIDQAWMLTEHHAAPVKEILGDKLRITRNAVEVDKYHLLPPEKRNPRKVLFCSDISRGALTAIRTFKRAAIGQNCAEMHLFYGFTPLFWNTAKNADYCYIPDCDGVRRMDDYVREVWAAVDRDPRIVFHGRVSWDVMREHMLTAGTWLYPTRFEEISCMSAMEAQCAGLCVVSSDMAALKETIDWDDPLSFCVEPDDAESELRDAMKEPADSPRRIVKSNAAKARFSEVTLANDWVRLIAEK